MTIFFLFVDQFINCEIQSLVVLPTNSQVVEGQSVTLHCQVSNQAGYVQWSKAGLLLGIYISYSIMFFN